jgi:hypothetical protein
MPKQPIPDHGYTADQLKRLAKQRPNAAIAERLRAVAWAVSKGPLPGDLADAIRARFREVGADWPGLV